MDTMSTPEGSTGAFDSTAAVDFLFSWPGGKVYVTAIHPDKLGPKARTIIKSVEGSREQLEKFIAAGTKNGFGIYANYNGLWYDVNKAKPKASEKEVSAFVAAHVDADVDKSITDPAAFEIAKADLLETIKGMDKPPTVVIDSGNGFGCFWVLREPVRVTPKNRDKLKAINIALRKLLDADACENLDRVMRVPGTLNFPNAAKRKRNRPIVPTRLVIDDRDLGMLYTLDDFKGIEAAPPPPDDDTPEAVDVPDTVDLSRFDASLRKLIVDGPAEGVKYGDGSRSAFTYYVACLLRRSGATDGEIVAVITNPDYAAAEHVLAQKQREPVAQAMRIIAWMNKDGVTGGAKEFESDKLDDEYLDRLAASSKVIEAKRQDALEAARDGKPYTTEDFLMYLPDHDSFICIPQGSDEMWPGKNVSLVCNGPPKLDPAKADMTDAQIAEKYPEGERDRYLRDKDGEVVYWPGASTVAGNPKQRVGCMTWWPGKPAVIRDAIFREAGYITKQGANAFNRYRKPRLKLGTGNPDRWLDHVKLIYPDDWQHIVHWLAWRVQRPDVKILHALVLGGSTRIGKDTLLKPVAYAVGPWNFKTTNAQTIMDEPKYNDYLEAVICLINEAQDFGDQDRYAFYNRTKPWLGGTASGVLMVANKYVKAHPVVDVLGVIITTNHKVRGLYLPDDDARHYIAWSNRTWDDWGFADLETLDREYFKPLYEWYASGGIEAVASYLTTLDVSAFSPTAPPPKTDAWHEIVNAYADPHKNKLTAIIEKLGNPPAVTTADVSAADAHGDLDWLTPKGRNTVPAQMEDAGYVAQRNPDNKRGRWQIGPKDSRRELYIYVQAKLGKDDRLRAAREVFDRDRVKAAKAAEATQAAATGGGDFE
jgi:hypothetical protein